MKESEIVVPHLFRCPISLDLFTDPVTLSTGQTYDRSSIEKWLSFGNQTCPVSMQKLQDPSMVPNHTLLHLINQWVQMGHPFHPHSLKINDPDFLLASSLRQILESNEPTFENRVQTLQKIQDLPQSCLIQLGFFPLLLKQVFRERKPEFSEENLIFMEKSLVYVVKLLPFSALGELNMLKEDDPTLAYFVELFDKGTVTIKKSLCHIVKAISSSTETKELCLVLGNSPLLLRKLIQFLEYDYEATVNAMSALSNLEPNRESLIKEGAIQGLVRHILSTKSQKMKGIKVAMATLEVLLGEESGRKAIANYTNSLDALVKMVFRYSDHDQCSESAVNSLIVVCSESLHAREEVICFGVLSQLLLLLQCQCDERIKKRARILLKLLRSTCIEDPKNIKN